MTYEQKIEKLKKAKYRVGGVHTTFFPPKELKECNNRDIPSHYSPCKIMKIKNWGETIEYQITTELKKIHDGIVDVKNFSLETYKTLYLLNVLKLDEHNQLTIFRFDTTMDAVGLIDGIYGINLNPYK